MITLVVAATASTAIWEKFGANSLTCDVCELLIGWVESFIGSNATFADVLNSLDFFCNHITPSGPYRESCLKYAMEIADGLPELWPWTPARYGERLGEPPALDRYELRHVRPIDGEKVSR